MLDKKAGASTGELVQKPANNMVTVHGSPRTTPTIFNPEPSPPAATKGRQQKATSVVPVLNPQLTADAAKETWIDRYLVDIGAVHPLEGLPSS